MCSIFHCTQVDLDRKKAQEEEVKGQMEGIELLTIQMKHERAELQQKAERLREKLQKVCV